MILSRTLFGSACVAILVVAASTAQTPKPAEKKDDKKPAKKDPSTKTAEELLKPAPRPKKEPLPPSELPLKFVKHERIAFVGNSLGERMSLFGNFEAMLHLRHPDLELVIRNFCRPADEVANRQRSSDYTKLDDPLYAFNPDTFLCFFGFNESFAGPEGVEKFKADYEKFIDEFTKKYPRDDVGTPPRFVMVSPIAAESAGDSHFPDAAKQNANLKLYSEAAKAVAANRKLAFIDIFTPSMQTFNTVKDKPASLRLTINGVHLNNTGDLAVAGWLDAILAGKSEPIADTQKFEKLRAAVVDQCWIHEQDYRMLDGWYVYGGRRTYDTETFPREYVKIRNMCAVRDRYLWDIAPRQAGTGETR